MEFLSGAGLLEGLQKFASQTVRQRGSSPKFAREDHSFWGRLVESTVGAHLLNSIRGTQIELFYWREGDNEVDFVLKCGDSITAIEVKSGPDSFRRSGIDLFVKEFKHKRVLLVGHQGIPVADFLKSPVTDFVG